MICSPFIQLVPAVFAFVLFLAFAMMPWLADNINGINTSLDCSSGCVLDFEPAVKALGGRRTAVRHGRAMMGVLQLVLGTVLGTAQRRLPYTALHTPHT